MIGVFLLIGHGVALLIYAAAVFSGLRAIKALRPEAAFDWSCILVSLRDWSGFLVTAGEMETDRPPVWGILWLAVYFSSATSALFFMLTAHLMVVTDYAAAPGVSFFYLPAHFGAAIGAVLIHLHAFYLIKHHRG